jgi:hypothetical protein
MCLCVCVCIPSAGQTPSLCATQCKATAGCQYFIMKKPAVAGGTSTCYLKMHALGGLYGNTGWCSHSSCTGERGKVLLSCVLGTNSVTCYCKCNCALQLANSRCTGRLYGNIGGPRQSSWCAVATLTAAQTAVQSHKCCSTACAQSCAGHKVSVPRLSQQMHDVCM